MIAQHPHCVASVNLPAHDLDLHIFSNRMMIATKCDTSPARRKIFMVFMLQQKTLMQLLTGLARPQEAVAAHKTPKGCCAGVGREATSCAVTVGRLTLCARDARHRLRGFRLQIRVCRGQTGKPLPRR